MLLPQSFYQRDTVTVAEQLLGKILSHSTPQGTRSGIIVETEAYLGAEDLACHTAGGRRTPRTEPMYGPAGTAYIYLIYGIYNCFNVVTGNGEAVLVRALEPKDGFSKKDSHKKVLNGPGKLCQQLAIARGLNGQNLFNSDSPLKIFDASEVSKDTVLIGARIGISELCGDAQHYPLRFGLRGNPHLSPPRFQ